MNEYQELLTQSIHTLYEVFEKYPIKTKIEGCPCCISDQEESRLHTNPLHELTQEDLRPFIFASQTTIGDANDFKHFLPRILDLITKENFIGLPEVIIGHIKYLDFKQWPLAEQEAIEIFLLNWWNHELAIEYEEYMPFYNVVDCLTSINRLEDDFIKYLEAGLKNKSVNAIPHLLEVLTSKTRNTLNHYLWNENQLAILYVWLEKKETIDAFKKHECFKLNAWKLPNYYLGMEDL